LELGTEGGQFGKHGLAFLRGQSQGQDGHQSDNVDMVQLAEGGEGGAEFGHGPAVFLGVGAEFDLQKQVGGAGQVLAELVEFLGEGEAIHAVNPGE
jgi:hypothetical protein